MRQEDAFGHFQPRITQLESRLLQNPTNALEKPGAPKLDRGDVHGHGNRSQAAYVFPTPGL